MKTYYDKDASLKHIKNKNITIIGYGIQGRAQALNLRDSGCNITIGNRNDSYNNQAIKDGFVVKSIDKAIIGADIVLILIPDQAQENVYNSYIKNNIKENTMLVFAHGYSIHYKKIIPPKNTDICLLAPRMPGEPIRNYYLNGGGVPAFIDVYQNFTGSAWNMILALAKGIGATKTGAMHITFQEETETDLFIEQFLLPLIIGAIRLSFDELSKLGFTSEALLMELYASGEIGELILKASEIGIYKVWEENASPTCQFGIYNNLDRVLNPKNTKSLIIETLDNIRSGKFSKELEIEAKNNYKNITKYNKKNNQSLLASTQENLNKILKTNK